MLTCRPGERDLRHLGQPVVDPGGVLVVGQAAARAVDVQLAHRPLVLDHSATGVSNAARERHRSQAAAHPAGEHVDVLVRGERYAGKRVGVF